MSRSLVLVVDDSDAIVDFERAALSAEFAVSSATDGAEALRRMREAPPDVVVLDLSMPVMDGEEVLSAMRADVLLAEIPVLVVSSELQRGNACLGKGAAGFLHKPVVAAQLRQAVARLVDERRARVQSKGVAGLALEVGPAKFAIPLSGVEQVLARPWMQPLLGGPPWLREMFELRGTPVAVVDLWRRLGVTSPLPPRDHLVVVLAQRDTRVALCVDRVHDPVEYAEVDVLSAGPSLDTFRHGPLAEALLAVVRGTDELLPLLDPRAFISARRLRALPSLLRRASPSHA